MRLVPIDEARSGMRLGQAIRGASGRLLLSQDAALSDAYIGKLRGLGIHALYVQDPDTDDVQIPQPVSPQTRQRATDNLVHTFQMVAKVAEDLRSDPVDVVRERIRSTRMTSTLRTIADSEGLDRVVGDVEDLVDELMDQDVLAGLNSIKTHDTYTFHHSIDVTLMGLTLAKQMGWDKRRLVAFGVGCILHDIGKIFVDAAILNKPSRLTLEEQERVRTHPLLGYEIIKAIAPRLGPLAPQVAYQHHERQDGTGYPRGLKGSNKLGRAEPNTIHEFGSLAAVADVYDAMASSRPYRSGMATDCVVAAIKNMAGRELNEAAVKLFCSVVAPYPVCSDVRITDGKYTGYRGVVTAVPPERIDRPNVRLLFDASGQRIEPIELDLAIEEDMPLECALGYRPREPDHRPAQRLPDFSDLPVKLPRIVTMALAPAAG